MGSVMRSGLEILGDTVATATGGTTQAWGGSC